MKTVIIENILNRKAALESLDIAGFGIQDQQMTLRQLTANRRDNYVQDYNKERVFIFKELKPDRKVTFFV